MSRTIRVGVLRTDLTIQSQEQWCHLFPDDDLVFVPIFPKSPDDLVEMKDSKQLDYIHLRPMTLVDKVLEEKTLPLVMPWENGQLMQLIATHLSVERFDPKS